LDAQAETLPQGKAQSLSLLTSCSNWSA